MKISEKEDSFGSMTRRALLRALPAVPAIPALTCSSAEAAPADEKHADNQPAYSTTPHIEAFYERSRF